MNYLIPICLLLAFCPAAIQAGTIQGRVEVNKGGKSADNLLVYLEEANGIYPVPTERPQMNHVNLQFDPVRLAVLEGTTVDFPNSDSVFHSAFSISDSNPFDLGVYGQGREKFVLFKNPGLVEIFCHIHSHMRAFLMVLENPFFVSTSKEGNYRIEGVPVGTYRVTVWMAPFIQTTKFVSLKGSKPVSLNFSLQSD